MADKHEPMTDEQLDEIDDLLRNNEQVPSDLVRLLADEVERLRAALEKEQREHGNCEDFHFRVSQAKTTFMLALAEQNAAMRPIVERAAVLADPYRNCPDCGALKHYDAEREAHASTCAVGQARTFLAAHPTKE